MRVLLLSLFYTPDEAAGSILLADVAAELVAAGHEVEVLCSSSVLHQPKAHPPARELLAGIQVHRIYCGIFDAQHLPRRLMCYLRFYWGVAWRLLMLPRPQVMICQAQPPLLPLLIGWLQRFRRTPFIYWLRSLSPEREVARGWLRPNTFWWRLARRWVRNCYRRASAIVVPSPRLARRVEAELAGAERTLAVIPDWADGDRLHPLPMAGAGLLTETPIERDLAILLSGTLEAEHESPLLAPALARLAHEPGLRFLVGGTGSWRRRLEALAERENWTHVTFLAWQPLSELNRLLATCDIGLVTLNRQWAGVRESSKIASLLAAGKPYLYVGDPDSDGARWAQHHHCGWAIAEADVEAFCSLLCSLRHQRAEIEARTQNARATFERLFRRDEHVRHFRALVEAQVAVPRARAAQAGG